MLTFSSTLSLFGSYKQKGHKILEVSAFTLAKHGIEKINKNLQYGNLKNEQKKIST